MGAVIKEARLNGIRPMTIERLLAFLGYDMNTPVVGRVEAVDANAMRAADGAPADTESAKPAIDTTTKADTKADDNEPKKPRAKKAQAEEGR